MLSRYLIFFFILNILGICLQLNHPTFFPSGFLFKNKHQPFSYFNIDDQIKAAKKNFKAKQKFINLHKFSELEIMHSFENYLYVKLLEKEFVASFEHNYFELFYGLDPWDQKFFQRLKTNFNFYKSEIFILLGLEELYSFDKYLFGVNLIIDLEILF